MVKAMKDLCGKSMYDVFSILPKCQHAVFLMFLTKYILKKEKLYKSIQEKYTEEKKKVP